MITLRIGVLVVSRANLFLCAQRGYVKRQWAHERTSQPKGTIVSLDPKNTVFLIDGSSFLYRAYYGVRPLHTTQGVPVQAVFSFCRMIQKLITRFKPHYMAIIWDSKGKTTRHEMYQEYKATRQAAPSDLFDQKEYIVEFANLIKLHQHMVPGLEADDIMNSIAIERKRKGETVVLVTSDKDMSQLLDDDKIVMYDAFKDQVFMSKHLLPRWVFLLPNCPFTLPW